jgi:hypothetical protein
LETSARLPPPAKIERFLIGARRGLLLLLLVDKKKELTVRELSTWRLRRRKGKSRLVKNNMARNEDALNGKVHAAIALMMR